MAVFCRIDFFYYLCTLLIKTFNLLFGSRIKKMEKFGDQVRKFLWEEKGIDIEKLSYMEMPEERERYDVRRCIGSVSLSEGRFITKSEADALTDKFLSMSLP